MQTDNRQVPTATVLTPGSANYSEVPVAIGDPDANVFDEEQVVMHSRFSVDIVDPAFIYGRRSFFGRSSGLLKCLHSLARYRSRHRPSPPPTMVVRRTARRPCSQPTIQSAISTPSSIPSVTPTAVHKNRVRLGGLRNECLFPFLTSRRVTVYCRCLAGVVGEREQHDGGSPLGRLERFVSRKCAMASFTE